jgi:hypothetical protein
MPSLHEYIESGLKEMPIGTRSVKPVVCSRFKGRFAGARSAVISSASVPDFRIYVHDGDHELKPKSVFGCEFFSISSSNGTYFRQDAPYNG